VVQLEPHHASIATEMSDTTKLIVGVAVILGFMVAAALLPESAETRHQHPLALRGE
jgi:hypothetical protein